VFLISFDFLVICQTINRTYQTISRQELQLALGRLSNNEFEALIKARGWKVATDDPNYVWIANHEENIKSRNIVEKIKFERKFLIIKPTTIEYLI
jgi:translation initiation factor 3 subunit K